MIKVAYIVSTLKRSGPTNQLFNMIKYLDINIFEPYVITLSNEPNESRWNDFIEIDLNLYSLKLTRVLGLPLIKRKITTLLNSIQPDIIHTQGIRADSLSALVLSKKYMTVSTLRNYPGEDYLMRYGRFPGNLMAKIHLYMLSRINRPVAVSKSIAQRIQSEKRLRLTTIWNGADNILFKVVDESQKIALRQKLGLPEERIILISVGHLSTIKNPTMIIEAFKKIDTSIKFLLLFLGSGPLEQDCTELAKGDNRIVFAGRVDHVNQYLQASDCFISASKSEGLPNSVIEALGCGLPVLLSAIRAHTEIFNGQSCPFPLFDINNISELICLLESLTKEKLIENRSFFRKVYENNFTALHMSSEYQKLYKNLIL